MQLKTEMCEPETLEEARAFFSIHHNAHYFLTSLRWPNGVFCPSCLSANVRYLADYRRYQCMSAHGGRQFTVKTGTVMQSSAVPIEKWAIAFWCEMKLNPPPSSYLLQSILEIRQATVWYMQKRVRTAICQGMSSKSLAESP